MDGGLLGASETAYASRAALCVALGVWCLLQVLPRSLPGLVGIWLSLKGLSVGRTLAATYRLTSSKSPLSKQSPPAAATSRSSGMQPLLIYAVRACTLETSCSSQAKNLVVMLTPELLQHNHDDTHVAENGRCAPQACSTGRIGEQQQPQTPRMRSGIAARTVCDQRQHLALMQEQLMAPLWLRSRQRRIMMLCLKSMPTALQMRREGLQHVRGRI